ncbi:hypothetical protein CS906_18555 [Enterobacter cloacae]|nr:hypothetical protein CS906_18555 [Enterobacter cloacae]
MRRPCGGGAPFFLLRPLPASSRLRRCALRLPPGESPAGYPRRAMLGAPRCSRTGCAGSARPMPQRLFVHHRRSTLHLHDWMGVPGQETWPVALSCFASSRLRRLAPDGLSSFPRSARLTPSARLPASGLRASLACGRHTGMAVALSSRLP